MILTSDSPSIDSEDTMVGSGRVSSLEVFGILLRRIALRGFRIPSMRLAGEV